MWNTTVKLILEIYMSSTKYVDVHGFSMSFSVGWVMIYRSIRRNSLWGLGFSMLQPYPFANHGAGIKKKLLCYTYLHVKSHYPYAPCMEYLPTFAQRKSPSFVGKYTSTMVRIPCHRWFHGFHPFFGGIRRSEIMGCQCVTAEIQWE